LVEEWLRNDMIKEAIRTLDRKINNEIQ